MQGLYERITRRKQIMYEQLESSRLDRCLTTLDLTALGIGSTLGVGIYVLAGAIARDEAGPAVNLSFFIAAIASVFAGLCYAEFGARVPKAGSAYVYSYVCVGELVAFVIGWNMILAYAIGVASVARGFSGYLDSLLEHKMTEAFREWMPIDVTHFSPYPDLFAFGITFLLTVVLSFGVKESTILNNILTVINICVVLYVIICGLFMADIRHWKITQEEIPDEYKDSAGLGGFMPFGIQGVMSGAASCFYGFVGFDVIATVGEEARDPQRAVPISIVVSLLCVFAGYFGMSSVLTLMLPYYLQDPQAPIPFVFSEIGWDVAAWVVRAGAFVGLSASLLGAMFPLPRVVYSMACDGLLFRILSSVHPRFQTPALATLTTGIFAGITAALVDLKGLVDLSAAGTLLAYTIVSACIVALRYRLHEEDMNQDTKFFQTPEHPSYRDVATQMFNFNKLEKPTQLSTKISGWGTIVFCVIAVALCAVLAFPEQSLSEWRLWTWILLLCLGVFGLLNLIAIARQPESCTPVAFKVPMTPLIPALSIIINCFLMMKLPQTTWIRFAVWVVLGLLIYVCYGIRESGEAYRANGKSIPGIIPAQDSEKQREYVTQDVFIIEDFIGNENFEIIRKRTLTEKPDIIIY